LWRRPYVTTALAGTVAAASCSAHGGGVAASASIAYAVKDAISVVVSSADSRAL